MRLKSYINENTNIAQKITRECSDILSLPNPLTLYRGSKKEVNIANRFIPRTDRIPSDIKMEIHNEYDKLFYEKFGWKARSEGVFASGSKRISYGKPYLFFPVNGYKFVWSPDIFDLYTSKFNSITNIEKGFKAYTDGNLRKAVLSGNEIIFKCKAYWLVNIYNDAGLDIIHEIM